MSSVALFFRGAMPETVSNVVESPTRKFAARLKDPSQWKILRDIPVFDEHEEVTPEMVTGPDGRPMRQDRIERFGMDELKAHADKCNALVASGNPPGLVLGHTKDDAPEHQQPETVGVGVNYRVRYDADLGRNVIAYDEYYLPEKYEQVKTYPYRSVERWRKGGYFKPIALLRREPRRNLGMVLAYQAQSRGELDRYSMVATDVTEDAPGNLFGVVVDTVVRYSMQYSVPVERYAMPHEEPDGDEKPKAPPQVAASTPPPPMPAPTPPAAVPPVVPNAAPPVPPQPAPVPGMDVGGDPSMMEPSDKDKQIFAKLCYAHPALGAMLKKYEAEAGGQNAAMPPASPMGAPSAVPPGNPVQMAAGAGMGSPSASNTMIPGVQQMSADTSEVERYAQMEQVIRSQNERIAELEKGERVARYAAKFGQLENEGWPIDAAEEVVRCQDYSPEQVEQHISDIKKYGAKTQRPLGPGIRPDSSPNPMRGGSHSPDRRLTPEEYDRAMEYMTENPGKSHTEAIKYAMNGAPVRG